MRGARMQSVHRVDLGRSERFAGRSLRRSERGSDRRLRAERAAAVNTSTERITRRRRIQNYYRQVPVSAILLGHWRSSFLKKARAQPRLVTGRRTAKIDCPCAMARSILRHLYSAVSHAQPALVSHVRSHMPYEHDRSRPWVGILQASMQHRV